MSNILFSWKKIFSREFHSREIDVSELESIVKDVIDKECPNFDIHELNYNEDGMIIVSSDGRVIEIEIDWNEIILS